MFTEVELLDAIDEIVSAKHSIQNCEKLASIFTVLDHLYPSKPTPIVDQGYSRDSGEIRAEGKSEFIEAINGKPSHHVWPLIEELVETIRVLNPRLYNCFMTKIQNL